MVQDFQFIRSQYDPYPHCNFSGTEALIPFQERETDFISGPDVTPAVCFTSSSSQPRSSSGEDVVRGCCVTVSIAFREDEAKPRGLTAASALSPKEPWNSP